MIARKSLATTVLAMTCLTALPSLAQVGRGTPGSQNNSATAQAGKALRDAKQNYEKAMAQVNKLKLRIENQLLAKPENKALAQELKKADDARTQAKKQAMVALQHKPEYAALVKSRDEAEATKTQAASGGSQVTDADLQKATDTYTSAVLQMKKMEKQFLADDPKYNEAETKYAAAKAKMDAIKAQADDLVKSDPEYNSLQQAVDQAKQQVDSAQQQYAQAAQQERLQREQEAKSRAASSSYGGGGGGGRGR